MSSLMVAFTGNHPCFGRKRRSKKSVIENTEKSTVFGSLDPAYRQPIYFSDRINQTSLKNFAPAGWMDRI